MGSFSDLQRQYTACQELLKKDDIISGFLRGMTTWHKLCGVTDQNVNRRGLAQRFTSLISCEMCYVVLYEGFLYVYKSETAYKPAKVFDLCTFQRVERDENLKVKGLPWPFKVSGDGASAKVLYFGASSEPELKKWIEAVKKGIGEARQSGRIPVITEKRVKTQEKQQPQSSSEASDEKESDLPIEDSVEEAEEGNINVKPLPEKPNSANIDSEDDCDYEQLEEGDLVKEATWTGPAEEGTEIMRSVKEDGIFMIRESTTGKGEQTLQVKSDDVVRKYRITKERDKIRIAADHTFNTMAELLSFYQKNSIPNHSTKLTKPYSKI